MTRTRNISDLLDSNGDVKSGSLDNVPAVDLTNLSATNLTSGTIPAARFPSTIDGRDLSTDGTKLDGIEASADVTDTTNVAAAGALMTTGGSVTGDVSFGDNDKAQFGAGSDLQIYHDGSNSYISDQGTNDLKVLATDFQLKNAADNEFMMTAVTDGAVTMYHNNSAKIATTSSGVDVTGTVTSDGLTVDSGTTVLSGNVTNQTSSSYATNDGGIDNILSLNSTGSSDTQSCGIQFSLTKSGQTGAISEIGAIRESSGNSGLVFRTRDSGTGRNERMRIDSAGNLGIGTSSPDSLVHLSGANPKLHIRNSSDSNRGGYLQDNGSAFVLASNSGVRSLVFSPDNTERMRLTVGGNLNIGKSVDGFATAGLGLRGDANVAQFTRSGDSPLELNRLSNSGDLIGMYKDSSNAGSIGVANTSEVYFTASGGNGTGLYMSNGATVVPMKGGSVSDNTVDCGHASYRFDNIRATNGTIQTSDQNEKQQIASLTTAEITAAKTISALFKTFKWNDKVESKGNAARIHTGVIAQEVQTAMTVAGLDAANYAFWCSDTWWETSTDVPAVEAVDEVTDEDGNVTTEAVEAKDAYTRIDTYETADEAPDGATQRTRMGIRYPELLAFIGASTEQRLADIETRLTALEAG